MLFSSLVTLASAMQIIHSDTPHMVGDGFRVFNYFPNELTAEATSPFLLLDYQAPHKFPPTKAQRGVGAHPHRGFETVTLVYEGALAHRDSKGHSGTIGSGDVQWMTAASGVLHEEFHEASFAKSGGTLHAIQLWVNLPARHKMSTPKYQTLLNAQIPHVQEDGIDLRVIAGSYKNAQGPASTFTPINLYDVKLDKGKSIDLTFDKTHQTLLLVMEGALELNGQQLSQKDLARLSPSEKPLHITATKNSFLCVMSGSPIHEPVVQWGPFVMNSEREIEQAKQDYSSGKFGRL